MINIQIDDLHFAEFENRFTEKAMIVFEKLSLKLIELKTNSKNEYIDRKGAAAYLKCSLPTIDKATKEGLIPSYRIMGSIRYLISDLDSSLMNRKFNKPGRDYKYGK